MTTENWKSVVGYEGFYEVSDLGRVRSLDRIITRKNGVRVFAKGVLLAQFINGPGHGYLAVSLNRNGTQKVGKVHRLVALAFIGPQPKDLPHVCHSDGNHLNNRVGNLRFGSPKDNAADAAKHGSIKKRSRARLSRDAIMSIKNAPGTLKQVSDRFDVHPTHVSRLRNGHHHPSIN